MSIPLIINGVTFLYPQQFDVNWGPTLTNWSSAVTTGMLQKAGGSFTLTSEVDFGASFGIKVKSLKSEESNIATTGILRLANASAGIVWRNAANGADLPLTVNASNQLTFNGTSIGATTALTNGHILVGNVSNQPADVSMSGDITIDNTGVTAIGAGIIVNADINASAAIALSKLATLTASKIVTSDSSGFLTTTSSPSLTELGYLTGATSTIQTQINTLTSTQANYLPLVGGTMSGAVNMGSNKITSVTQGSNTGEAISYPVGTAQVSALAITTALIASSAITQMSTGTSSVTLVTTGGYVMVFAQTDASGTTAAGVGSFNGYDTTFSITKDSSSTIYSARSAAGGFQTLGKTVIIPFNGCVIDSPTAASHTYTCSVTSGTGSFSASTQTMFAIEIKR